MSRKKYVAAAASATATASRIVAGETTAAAALDDWLAAIEANEPTVQALVDFDADAAKAACSSARPGPLHGIAIGVKDVIETAALPTRFGSPLYTQRPATQDAAVVAALRARGAYVLAKTATVEFASLGEVPATVNPHDPARTPGGSSSGSAAAVAAGMMPIALGTQTGGSIIRPASFCGVAALKPTWGTVPVAGLRPYAPSLDTIGWMASCVADLALIAGALEISLTAAPPPGQPRIGVYRTPYWQHAGPDSRAALETARAAFTTAGFTVEDVAGPDDSGGLNEAQDTIMHGEGRQSVLADWFEHGERLNRQARDEATNARGFTAGALRDAYDYLGEQRRRFDAALSGYDAWLTPAVPGEAPVGHGSTGDAVFNRLWTGLHTPCITLPGPKGGNGMPVGVQLVARRFDDARLLQVAALAEQALAATS
ncbi:MAG: amidase [Pseudomonadota bacterium]